MNRYTVNFMCTDQKGHNDVRSEELNGDGIYEVVEKVKDEWRNCEVEVIWAGIRQTDGEV